MGKPPRHVYHDTPPEALYLSPYRGAVERAAWNAAALAQVAEMVGATLRTERLGNGTVRHYVLFDQVHGWGSFPR